MTSIMKRILLVLAMIAGSVFLAVPAGATESDAQAPAAAVTQESPEAPPPAAGEPAVPKEPAAEQVPEEPAQPPVEEPKESVDADVPESAPQAELPPTDMPTDIPKDVPESKAPAARKAPGSVLSAAPVKIKICHASASQTNPYIENSPNASGDLHGHTGHTGPVWVVNGPAGWGDIIPPFVFNNVSYPGLNWTPAGQTIYNNNCAPVGQPPVVLASVTAVSPTATSPTCLADGALVLPTTVGVIYQSTPAGTGPGTYTVTASADVGYQITNPAFEVTITVLPKDTSPACQVNGLLPATAVPPTISPATCSANGGFAVAVTPGVVYLVLPLGTARITTAFPAPGYFLTNPLFFDFKLIPQELTGPQCDSVNLTICHRTNSNVNPYVTAGPATAGDANGHDTQHEGPLWDPTLKAQHIEWGDIIPPYTYNDVDYPGQNWTAGGQAIWAIGCVPTAGLFVQAIPAVTTTSVCDGGMRPTPTVTAGISYQYTLGDGLNGPWEITATALPNFEIPDNAQVVFTGDAGNAASCLTPAVTSTSVCDGGTRPTPTATAGISYQYTVGDGVNGPWEITASALPGFFLVDGAQTAFTGNAGDAASCLTPVVVVKDTCDGAESPTPTMIEGIAYAYTVGDGQSGAWEITTSALPGFFLADGVQTVFTGDAGDPDSCVVPGDDDEPGDGVKSGDEEDESGVVDGASGVRARDDELLPDTGGVPLWPLLLAGPMTAAGFLILMRRRPVEHGFTSVAGASYSLGLPPSEIRSGASMVKTNGIVRAVRKVSMAIGTFLKGQHD